jgi:hypothetical protein
MGITWNGHHQRLLSRYAGQIPGAEIAKMCGVPYGSLRKYASLQGISLRCRYQAWYEPLIPHFYPWMTRRQLSGLLGITMWQLDAALRRMAFVKWPQGDDNERRQRVLELRAEGVSYNAIELITGIPSGNAHYLANYNPDQPGGGTDETP